MSTRYRIMDSPVGRLMMVASAEGIREIRFGNERPAHRPEPGWVEGGRMIERAQRQLEEYFRGERQEFDLPLDPQGTAFQQRVWKELRRIPFGKTLSYGELARRIGKPSASRAVGAANGKNPISIVVPCHRVIGADGSLTGFGGGLPTKRALLTLEGHTVPRSRALPYD